MKPSPRPQPARPVGGGRYRSARDLLRQLLPAPLWVLLLVLLLTVTATATVRQLVRQQQTARFEREVTTYQRELRQRFQSYAGVLYAVRASWEAVAAVQQGQRLLPAPALSSQQFERLVRGLDLQTRYPGLSSLGYAPLLGASGRAIFARQLPLLAGDPSAQLHPSSSLPMSAPVVYLAPAGTNRSVLGYDMYTDAVRRQAIGQAVSSGEIRSTGQVALLNLPSEDQDRYGLILYLPIRSEGRVTGLLYAPVKFGAVLPPPPEVTGRNQISLRVALDGQRLLGQLGQGTGSVADSDARLGFQQSAVLRLAGQDWTLAFSAPPGFGSDAAANVPWLVLLAGTLVALLAALATQAQVRARVRAEQISHSLSLSQSRLERSRAEFEAVFRAMQDTAIFTDPSGRVLFANDALSRSFGLSPFELRGAPLADLHADPLLLSRLDALPGPHLVTTLFRRKDGLGSAGQAAGSAGQETGGLFYGEMQRSRVVGEGGETLGQLEVIRDVSERLQADRALREGERRYQGVLEGMPQIVFLTDAAGRVSYFNRRWWEYVGERPDTGGRPPQGMPGHPSEPSDLSSDLLRAIHPDDRADFARRWQVALASGSELEIEHRLRSGGGVYRTFVTRGRPIRDPQGRVQEWVGSSTDIDDQIYAEANSRLLADVGQALSDRHRPGAADGGQAEQDTAQEVGGTASWQADSGLKQALDLMTIRFADSAAFWPSRESSSRELYGQHPAAGPPVSGATDSAGAATLPTARPAPLIAGRVRRIGLNEQGQLGQLNDAVAEVMYLHEPGILQETWLHSLGLSSAVLYPLSQDGLPLGVLGLGFRQPLQDRDLELGQELAQRLTSALDNRNLLARLHAARESLQELNGTLEQRVAERTAQLSEANGELEAFSYSVSHDLRTPLRHIMGFADLLSRETSKEADAGGEARVSPKAARYLNIITDSAGRMSKLIDDLLEFSRTSRAELRRNPVDLGLVVQDSLADLAPDQGERQVEWRVGPLPTVIGDAGLLRQVVDNLLSNALKYTRTRERAVIEIAAQQQGREVWLSVRDNGVGFDPDYASKLFGVFQRLHKSDDFEGTGIGLANVRRIVARHGGRVWAESGEAQAGATFWMALPLEPLTLEKAGKRQSTPAFPADTQGGQGSPDSTAESVSGQASGQPDPGQKARP